MNYLFYLGIIAPTLITILLFVIFVYCWFLQKARKEVLTKKYDPHGKMRRLGIPMESPPPPPYCRIDDDEITHFVDNGEDNEAYDVSRSPSTEQNARGRPLYHTYHDSGISAGLSPSQESEPRPGLSYRTCPDSGISGFSVQASATGPPQQHACRGCCQAREQVPQMHQQPQQQQQRHPLRHQQPQQVMLHHNTIQASVHPSHGVCYGDDTTHPQSPQHYNPPPIQSAALGMGSQPACGARHFTTMPHIREQPIHLSSSDILEENLCYCSNSPKHQNYNPHGIQQCCQEELMDGLVHEYPQPPAYPATFRPQIPRAAPPPLISSPKHESLQNSNSNMMNMQTSLSIAQTDSQPSKGGFPPLPKPPPSSSSPPSLSSTQLPRHSYRDSGVLDVGQTQSVSERPDSQASTSSTTDSEDSGFRSSHCAASHGSKLSKQGNPLLKPLRRPRNLKTRPKSTRAGDKEDLSVHGATPLSTLNPQNLQSQVSNNTKPHNVIQTTSLLEDRQGQRSPPRILQQHNALKCTSNSIPETTSPNTANNYQNDSPGCHSPSHAISQETNPKQHMDMTEISTHLSWKYLQDHSVSSNSSQDTSNSQDGLQMCHTSVSKAAQFQGSPEHQMEIFSYSIV